MGNFNKYTGWVTFVILVAIILGGVGSAWGYLSRSGDHLYASVTGFEYQLDSIDIGSGSQVNHSALSDKAFVIKPTRHGYSYRVNRDTCLYYKINNINPNKHTLRKDCSIELRLDSVSEITLDGARVIEHLQKYKGQAYFMLYAVYASMSRGDANRDSVLDKLREYNHSFIHHQNGQDDFNLIILDSMTYLQTPEALEGYKYEGEVRGKKDLKVQFLRTHDWERMAMEEYLSDSTKSYYAKPYVLLSAWGAGHFLFSQRTDEHARRHISVRFPKAITTTIDIPEISTEHERGGLAIFLDQLPKEGYIATDYYIPPFSNLYSNSLLELTKVPSDTLIFPNHLDSIQISTSRVSDRILNLGSGKIFLHYAHLDASFFSLTFKFIALASVFIIFLVLIGYYQYQSLCKGSDNQKMRVYLYYSCALFSLLTFYLCQRLIIADKLSFSYPYFEKIHPVTLFVVFGLLLSIGNIFMLIARHIRQDLGVSNKRTSWVLILSSVLGSIILAVVGWYCYAPFVELVQSSYLSGGGMIELSTYLEDNHLLSALVVSWVWLLTNYFLLRGETAIEWKWSNLKEVNSREIFIVLAFLIVFALTSYFNYKLVGSILGFPFEAEFFIIVSIVIFFLVWWSYPWLVNVLKKINDWSSKINEWSSNLLKKINAWPWLLNLMKNYGNLILLSVVLFLLVFAIRQSSFGAAVLLFLSVCCFLLGLSIAKGKYQQSNFFGRILLVIWPVVIIFVFGGGIAFALSDNGFVIYLFGVLLASLLLTLFLLIKSDDKWQRCVPLIVITLCLYIISPFTLSKIFVKTPESYNRSDRRIQNFLNPESVRNQGYAHTEADRQWLDLMFFYATGSSQEKGRSGFYEEYKLLHPLVSTGQSPVVLNDMSLPAAYMFPMGSSLARIFIIGPLIIMLLIISFSAIYVERVRKDVIEDDKAYIKNRFPLVLRIVAQSLWMGVSVYIMLSYFEQVPYTGRLIPGFGVDSWNEVIEVFVFFGAMAYFTYEELEQ